MNVYVIRIMVILKMKLIKLNVYTLVKITVQLAPVYNFINLKNKIQPILCVLPVI